MKTDCKPPKCAVVKEKCQCPNPWLEHLAHTAADRKAKGLKRLSIKQHAKDYKKAVRTGTQMSESYPPGGWDRDLLTFKSLKVLDLKQTHLYITEYKGRRLVFKEFELKRLGDRVPRLYKAYFLNRKGHRYGIQIMQCAPGIPLEDFLPDQTSPLVLHDLAVHLKDTFDALRKAKVWHGDMHAGNWMIDVAKNGNIKSLTLIDFDYAVVDAPDLRDRNVLRFLSDTLDEETSKYLPLLPYLYEVGMNIPADILKWDGHDFEKEYSHLEGLCKSIVREMSADPDMELEVITA